MTNFRWCKIVTVSILLMGSFVSAASQELSDTLLVYFQKEKAIFERDYRENGLRTDEFIGRIRSLQEIGAAYIVRLEMTGVASPEGDTLFNNIISNARRNAVYKYIKVKADIPDSLIQSYSTRDDWETLARAVEKDPKVSSKSRVLDIIRNGGDSRLDDLLEVEYGRPYWYIYHNIFPELRACRVVLHYGFDVPLDEPVIDRDQEIDLSEDYFADIQIDTTLNVTIQEPVVFKRLALKTNAAGWAMGQINAAVEVDLIPHLSLSLPVYYSGGYNYFKETIKFRGIVVQPELRYYPWLKDYTNKGFYVGAHLGIGWYNFALNGDYRVQDHKGNRPAWGGGIGVGYALNFKKHPRWGMEFTLGAGVYDVKYDMFHNVENGAYYKEGVHKTWVGVDNAAITFTYDFDLKK